MSVIIDGERSRKWVSFAQKKLVMVKDMDIPALALKVNGYLIQVLSLDGIEKISIKAPPGAVVVSRQGDNTSNTYEYKYADQYGGDFSTLLSRPGSGGIVPLTAFSAVGDLVYLATADYSAPIDKGVVLAASWYAPRPSIPTDPFDPNGFISGAISVNPVAPQVPGVGYAFTRSGTMYAASMARAPSGASLGLNAVATVVRGANYATVTFDIRNEYPEFTGRALFVRPEWGADAMIVFVFHRGGVCGSTLGPAQVRVYYVQTAQTPFAITSATFVGAVTQNTLAAALGLPPPCAGADDGTALSGAMSNLLGAEWPINPAPYKRGMFPYGPSAMCVWGPMVDGVVRGLLLQSDNTAEVVPVTFPPHNDFALYPQTTEVSPGHYCCEMWTTAGVSDTGEITKVYYGSPMTGVWVELPHPPGVILRHRTVQATAAHTIALAVMYNAGANETVLHEYDSRKSTEWRRRGKIGAGKVTRPSVALFGNHEYARMASTDSAVARLWD